MRRRFSILWLLIGCNQGPDLNASNGQAIAPDQVVAPGDPQLEQVLELQGARLEIPVQKAGPAARLEAHVKPSNIVGVSRIYDFGPEGTTFDPPARLTLTLGNEDTVDGTVHHIANNQNGVWQQLEDSAMHPASRSVTASLHHLSEYAVVSSAPTVIGTGSEFRAGAYTLQASAPLTLFMSATPGAVHLFVADSPQQTLRVGGLESGRTYYVYFREPGTPAHMLTADAAGVLSVDLIESAPIDVLILPEHGTNLFGVYLAGLDIGCFFSGGVQKELGCDLYLNTDTVVVDTAAPEGYTVNCVTGRVVGADHVGVGVWLAGRKSSLSFCSVSGFSTGIHVPLSNGGATIIGVTVDDVDIGITATSPNVNIAFSQFRNISRLDSGLVAGGFDLIGTAVVPVSSQDYLIAASRFDGYLRFATGLRGTGPNQRSVIGSGIRAFGNTVSGISIASALAAGDDFALTQHVSIVNNSITDGVGLQQDSLGRVHQDVNIDDNVIPPNTDAPPRVVFGVDGIGAGPCNNCTYDGNSLFQHNIMLSGQLGAAKARGNTITLGGMTITDGGQPTDSVVPVITNNTISTEGFIATTRVNFEGTRAVFTGNKIFGGGITLRTGTNGNPGAPTIAQNDVSGSLPGPALFSFFGYNVGAEAGINRVTGTSARGNYWGVPCPSPAFVPGLQSNSSSVTDSNAWGIPLTVAHAGVSLATILSNTPPGCNTLACFQSAPTTILVFSPPPHGGR